MKNNIVNLILVLITILLQMLAMYFWVDPEYYHSIPFATDGRIADNMTFNTMSLLYLYFPIPFILLFFWGTGAQITEGYGKLIVTRNYDPRKLCLVSVGKMALALGLIVIVQTVTSIFFDSGWGALSVRVTLKALTTYYSGLFILLLLQFLMEICGQHKLANILVNVAAAGSLIAGTEAILRDRTGILNVVLFPNLMFGSRNGLILHDYTVISWRVSFIVLGTIVVILIAAATVTIKRRDIF